MIKPGQLRIVIPSDYLHTFDVYGYVVISRETLTNSFRSVAGYPATVHSQGGTWFNVIMMYDKGSRQASLTTAREDFLVKHTRTIEER